ncbi:MAG: hypothetical protein F6J95_002810 [Leptolyngbya sp. SIO1E4]|nr:hypothetical protein [Leptolyngbya sp. SIO1E4]
MARQLNQPLGATAIRVYQQNAHFVNRYGRWFLLAWLAALVDGKLLLAIAVSTLTYRLVTAGYRVRWATLESLCNRLCTPFLQVGKTPLGATILAFAGTYGLAAAWSELGGRWAATALIGLGLLNVVLLTRKSAPAPSAPPEPSALSMTNTADASTHNLDVQWQNLTAQDALKRLLAVRTLLRWSLSEAGAANYLPGTTVTVRSHLIDCFRVMLTHESEPLVRVALIEGLKALQPKPQLSAGRPAMQPLMPRPTPVEVSRSVEYVEP